MLFRSARSKNISRAAERLGIGQPSLSQAIQRLERILSTKLFDRFKTGIQLTAAGHRLLIEGKSALEAWDRLNAKTRAAESEIQGHFTIGCHSAVGAYTLPKFLEKIFRQYPEIELRLRHALSREILEEVVSFQVDFGLVMNPAPHQIGRAHV